MSEPSTMQEAALAFANCIVDHLRQRGLTDVNDVHQLTEFMIDVGDVVIQKFPHDNHETILVKLQESLQLYARAQNAASRGNDIAEIGPIDHEDMRDVYADDLMPPSLISCRDDKRNAIRMALATLPDKPLPA